MGSLEWSPVHSEKFWKENVKKFEENDFYLIK
jgi:V-type H+-transporting ATPase subunit H